MHFLLRSVPVTWRDWVAATAAVSLGVVLSGGRDAYGLEPQRELIRPPRRYATPPATSVQPPSQPVELNFDAAGNEPTPDEADLTRAAFQTQYPLPNDSQDLLSAPNRFDEQIVEPRTTEEESFDDTSEQPWVVWQKTTGSVTWLAPQSEGLGITTLDVRGSIEFPDFQMLWFVPRFGWHLLDGPSGPDLPSQLYDFSWEAVFAMPAGERWVFQAAVAPSLYSDLDNTGSDAFRLPGRLLAFWTWTETLKLTGGVFYLDRDDVKWLPVGGVIWTPTDDWKFELMAPRPRIAWRVAHEDDRQSWAYIVGEFGGGTWAIQRADGTNDVATIRDYRLLLGFEQKWSTQNSWLVEAGYVFNRRVEYTSEIGDSDLDDTALVRFGLTF